MLITTLSCLKLPEKKYIVTAPGDHIFLVYDDAQSFDTPIIYNHSVTAPSAQILFDDDDLHSFDHPPF